MLLSDRALVNCAHPGFDPLHCQKEKILLKKSYHQTWDYTIEDWRGRKEFHYWEVETERNTVKGQLGQKVSKTPSQPIKAG
jgi:hypothetical protein